MKYALKLLIVMLLVAGLKSHAYTLSGSVMKDENKLFSKITESHETAVQPGSDTKKTEWEIRNDSLRMELIKRKQNPVLRESFLQEMYIRDVATVSNGNLIVEIPFNLHAPDCGAPDCYSTDVSFNFKLGDSLVFPKNLPFNEHEHGCAGPDKRCSGIFKLIAETTEHVIYHSAKLNRTLVLFRSYEDFGTTAYYFTAEHKEHVNGKNLYQRMKALNGKEDPTDFPFTSVSLNIADYEVFFN